MTKKKRQEPLEMEPASLIAQVEFRRAAAFRDVAGVELNFALIRAVEVIGDDPLLLHLETHGAAVRHRHDDPDPEIGLMLSSAIAMEHMAGKLRKRVEERIARNADRKAYRQWRESQPPGTVKGPTSTHEHINSEGAFKEHHHSNAWAGHRHGRRLGPMTRVLPDPPQTEKPRIGRPLAHGLDTYCGPCWNRVGGEAANCSSVCTGKAPDGRPCVCGHEAISLDA